MTKGLIVEGGKIEIVDGARTTFTTDGTLINLLPEEDDINLSNINAAFPNFTKNNAYYWSGEYSGGIREEGCRSWGTVLPQNWNNFGSPIVLGAVPSSDIDFIDILCYARRVNNPSTWMGAAVPKAVPENLWFDMAGGSALVEAALGMSRSVSVVMSGGNVVLQLQQSISTPPEGWVQDVTSNKGTSHGGSKGIPVTLIEPKHYRGGNPVGDPYGKFVLRRGGDEACSLSDPSNHASTWRFDFRIAFGRRSQ